MEGIFFRPAVEAWAVATIAQSRVERPSSEVAIAMGDLFGFGQLDWLQGAQDASFVNCLNFPGRPCLF